MHLGRWGTVRLRMTLWNVAVLALILGALGGVVRYTVQADLFATVDRTLAERAHAERDHAQRVYPVIPVASPSDSRPEPAARDSRPALPRVPAGGQGTRGGGSPAASGSSWPDLAASAVPASLGEPTSVGEPVPGGPPPPPPGRTIPAVRPDASIRSSVPPLGGKPAPASGPDCSTRFVWTWLPKDR